MKECNQCGKCCIKYGGGDLSVTTDEIEMWALFNPNIYEYVKDDEIWFDPTTGVKLSTCPFLEIAPKKAPHDKTLYTCSIYLDRPEDCRHYPSLVSEMIRDECEMIEPVDIKNQTRAQHKLNIIMIDSRT
ncbi:YkgJ family cysteine cluster protein [Pseudoalteromonas espejiana]